ncbi:immunoglobulin superfamily containing leucine-rich repeat protein-like [Sphaerodactylus townsendi]|uniref:immunoglobulin superfamily containing leucine-rich repeat protein-like n=1 Tax=Sphaerodactylus townsendi TaxID=933632 RepID=UPI002026569D|nr:immunoglobulin superfamily containing leucine-rich repeat protein-like [Sphaerodactylus townsendi]
MDLLFCLVAAFLVAEARACPEVCVCVARKNYSRHIADCSYQDLHAVPTSLPSNTTTLTLSVNHITSLGENSFKGLVSLQGLWLTYNDISHVGKGTFGSLAPLKNLDLSHNQMMDFPWWDLQNLTALELLKLSNNRLEKVPLEAFSTLKHLRSLWLNDNRLTVLFEGTFDSTPFLSLLQINNNPFNCSCKVWWLKQWIESSSVSTPEKDSIMCDSPKNLKGLTLGRNLNLDCSLPSVQLTYQSSLDNSVLHDGLSLLLDCRAVGKPQPEIRWKIQASGQTVAINGPNVDEEGDNWLAGARSEESPEHFLVFKNGSMAISKFSKADEGVYTCQAVNDVGSREVSVNVALSSSENFAHDLQNNIQASKPRDKSCDMEELPKSEEKIVVIYLTPTVSKTTTNRGILWEPWLWGSMFAVLLLGLYT